MVYVQYDELGFYSGISPLNDTILICVLPLESLVFTRTTNGVLYVNNCEHRMHFYMLF